MISNTERCLSYQERQVGLILIAEGKPHSLETFSLSNGLNLAFYFSSDKNNYTK